MKSIVLLRIVRVFYYLGENTFNTRILFSDVTYGRTMTFAAIQHRTDQVITLICINVSASSVNKQDNAYKEIIVRNGDKLIQESRMSSTLHWNNPLGPLQVKPKFKVYRLFRRRLMIICRLAVLMQSITIEYIKNKISAMLDFLQQKRVRFCSGHWAFVVNKYRCLKTATAPLTFKSVCRITPFEHQVCV